MQTAEHLWTVHNSVAKRHTVTVDTLMAQWKAGEMTAAEVWAKFPGYPQLQHGTYVTSLTGVHSPWMGNHNLYHLYLAVVKETGGDPNAGGLARPGAGYILSAEDAVRKHAEQDEYLTTRDAAMKAQAQEQERNRIRRQYAGDREEYEEERIARIVRRVMREM